MLKGVIQPVYAKICISAASVSYQRGMGQHTSNKFKTSEQFHLISAFQKGGTEFITKYAPEGGLHVQAGPKRRLLLCSSRKGIKEISMVSVRRDTLQVPLPLFWSRLSFSDICQNFKGTNFSHEKDSDSCDNISGQHVNHVTESRKVINEQRYQNFSSDSIWKFE